MIFICFSAPINTCVDVPATKSARSSMAEKQGINLPREWEGKVPGNTNPSLLFENGNIKYPFLGEIRNLTIPNLRPSLSER